MCLCKKWFKNEYTFGAEVLRYAFGIYFLLVAVKKLRMGIPDFADAIVGGAMGTELLAGEMPPQILYLYGLALPVVEAAAGIMLIINYKVREAYTLIALTYLTFVFGQMYSGNTGKIGTDYLPSLTALTLAVFFRERSAK